MKLVRALPLLFLGGVAAILALRWRAIPERFPVHWGMGGQPDRWADRSAVAVFGPLVAGTALVVALLWLRRLLPRLAAHQGKGPAELRAGEGAVLGGAYALAAAFGAAAAQPMLAGPGPWAAVVGAGMGVLFVPFVVAAALWRRGR